MNSIAGSGDSRIVMYQEDFVQKVSRRDLRRLDFALGWTAAEAPRAGASDRSQEHACPRCENLLDAEMTIHLHWCGECRGVFMHGPGPFLCHVPEHWLPRRLLRFWERGILGLRECASDHAFIQFFCRRIGIDPIEAIERIDAHQPDTVRIGRHALAHRLLSRAEVAWVLRFQRAARSHRRRCFGEIAVTLGFWEPEVVPRLLAAQAERRRGLVSAIVNHYGVPKERLLLAEQAFFGIEPNGTLPESRTPFDSLMAA